MASDVIIYSAVTSKYDMVFEPKVCTEKVHYVLFSDRLIKIRGWDVLPINNPVDGKKSLTNRWYKLFPHKLFKEAEYSIYVDGNIRIIGDLSLLIQEFKESRAALGVFKHLDRTNIFQEADACAVYGKFDDRDKERIKDQLKRYSESGMPADQQLTDNGIIFRWHQHPKLSATMSSWWKHLQRFSKRDQISLPYVVWENNLPTKKWSWSFRLENPYFDVYPHRQSLLMDLVTIIRVYRSDYWLSSIVYRSLNYLRNLFQ